MYHYNICTTDDEVIFKKQCEALEHKIPDIVKGKLLNDVDGSQTQIYEISGKRVTVHNSLYIGSVYVDSEVDLEPYFN